MVSVLGKKKKQKTVKAFESDISTINKRAKKLGCSAADVIHLMCENLRKNIYLTELAESFDSVQTNVSRVAEFEEEQKIWDSTSSDGLDNAS